MKKALGLLIALTLVVGAYAQTIEHTFTRADVPQAGQVRITDVDFTATQDVDVKLPDNLRYILESGYIVTESVDTVSTGATVVVSEVTAGAAATNSLVGSFTLATNLVANSVTAVTNAQTVAVQGSSTLRVSITGGTATNDVKGLLINLSAF